ncbi:MAG: P1 family peptidase [Atopobiaceae bacterium]|nr:P1 family peptidase [Atopobiaceae bacterium]
MHKYESITDIEGIYVGHATNAEAGTGCTVIVCPRGAVGGVDVRGGAPATRETDLLRAEETVQELHAVVLSGGSAFGLAASTGVAEELERRDIGLDVGVTKVPIVSGACLFDLMCGRGDVRPTAADGVAAVANALDGERRPLAVGNVGAGTGCTVGKLAGAERCMKSGLGESVQTCGELVCGAISAVNAVGDVVDPVSGSGIAGLLDEAGESVVDSTEALLSLGATMPLSRTNTTISCVVTNARLTQAQATKVAQMAADAYAHTIRPTHTTNDGDTIFVLATGEYELPAAMPLDVVGVLATKALEGAIVDAALSATGADGFKAACDLM